MLFRGKTIDCAQRVRVNRRGRSRRIIAARVRYELYRTDYTWPDRLRRDGVRVFVSIGGICILLLQIRITM